MTGSIPPNALTFAALDGIAFAASRGRLGADVPKHVAADLGPIIEMLQLARTGLLPLPGSAPWLHLDGNEALLHAATGGADRWVSTQGSTARIFKCGLMASDAKSWTSFKVEAHKAALVAGFSAQTVHRLLGAMGEIVDNVLEHSQAAPAGFVVFRGRPGCFEYTVADAGVGTLASLRSNPEYAYLHDGGDALQCALTEGESRFGKAAGRGSGFSQLFRSLVSLNASLRFRSGDHGLSMHGVPDSSQRSHGKEAPCFRIYDVGALHDLRPRPSLGSSSFLESRCGPSGLTNPAKPRVGPSDFVAAAVGGP